MGIKFQHVQSFFSLSPQTESQSFPVVDRSGLHKNNYNIFYNKNEWQNDWSSLRN